MKKTIESVSDFLEELCKICKDEQMYVYRGENESYPCCMPGIFREKFLQQNEYFEQNILDKVISDGVDDNFNNYLTTAIEAQHGGFPSRLLDVSYNALIALHFATTPHYTKEITSKDDKDGKVTIFEAANIVSPSSKELIKFYEEEILDPKSIYNGLPIVFNSHLVIDHFKKNRRIDVQQGAFILFIGKEFREYPKVSYKEIIIPASSKEMLRRELNQLFGINNGYIYPEPNNLVETTKKMTNNYAPIFTQSLVEYLDRIEKDYMKELEFRVYADSNSFENRMNAIKYVDEIIIDLEISVLKLRKTISKTCSSQEERINDINENIIKMIEMIENMNNAKEQIFSL